MATSYKSVIYDKVGNTGKYNAMVREIFQERTGKNPFEYKTEAWLYAEFILNQLDKNAFCEYIEGTRREILPLIEAVAPE